MAKRIDLEFLRELDFKKLNDYFSRNSTILNLVLEGSSDTFTYLYETLGSESYVKLLLRQAVDIDEWTIKPVIALAATKRPDGLIDIIKHLKKDELEQILDKSDEAGKNTFSHILKSTATVSKTLKHIYEVLGAEFCINRMFKWRKNGQESPIIISVLKCWKQLSMKPILDCFTPDEIKEVLSLKIDHRNQENCTLVYYMLREHAHLDTWRYIHEVMNGCGDNSDDSLCSKILEAISPCDNKEVNLNAIYNAGRISKDLRLTDDLNTYIDMLTHLLQRGRDDFNVSRFEDHLKKVCAICNDQNLFRKAVLQVLKDDTNDPVLSALASRSAKTKWLIKELENKPGGYLLIAEPSILIICNRRDRQGADKEALKIKQALESHRLTVRMEYDLTKEHTMKAIKCQQSNPSSYIAQVVIMMSHGKAGHIFDNEHNPIPINDLVNALCPETHSHSPKLLILQCCQSEGDSSVATNYRSAAKAPPTSENELKDENPTFEDAGPANEQARIPVKTDSVSISQPHVAVILSCIQGQVSYRNEFIPKLAEEIGTLQRNQDLHDAFLVAHRGLTVPQTPIYSATLKYKFYLKNVFSIDGSRSCTIS